MIFTNPKKCQIAIVAIACALATSTLAVAQRPGTDEDLLNPILDQPLAQYESTSAVPFEPIVEAAQPAATKSDVSASRQPSAPAIDLSPRPNSGSRVQLAPNPLADPGSLTSETPNPIQVQPEIPKVPKAPWANEESEENSVETLITDSPEPKPPTLNPKPIPKKKPAQKKTQTPKKKQAYTPKQPVVNYNVYRDASHWPIDPRKPNSPCTQQGGCQCGMCASAKPGLHGRPYQPTEPGGCECGKRCPNKHPQFSNFWPRPFSAKLDERNPERAAARYSGCQKPKLNDMFDRFANFRLIDYQRTDNGYCGPESDGYGCLGESKTAGVAGVGFRVQSVPVAPAGVYPLR